MKTIIMAMLLCGLTLQVWAADSATLREASPLYQSPNGKATANLVADTLVQVLRREGAWYQIKLSDGRRGYVRLGKVRFGEEKSSESVFGGLWSWLNSSHRSQDEMSTATAGVRGFDNEQLQAAQPDYDAVKALTGLAVGADSARKYAASLPVKARSVPELKQ